MNTMVNLCHKNLFLALLLLITECHLSMSRERDYTICNENPPYVFKNKYGCININHNKLEQLGKCTLTLMTCENCVIDFSTFGKDVNGICTATEMNACPCHLSNFSMGDYMNELRCYKRRCPYIKISTTPNNRMILIPSYQANCQFSTMSSMIYIDVCQSQTNFTGMNMRYKVHYAGLDRRWLLKEKFHNFTMCVNIGGSDLHLGTQGFIHLSNCSGRCMLVLSSCKKCKINFYMNIRNLAGSNQPCLTIKISDKYKSGDYITFSPSQSNYLNYTTFSKAATLEICQSNIETLQLNIFYEVIEKLETKLISTKNITLLHFPPSYPSSDEIFKYYIKKSIIFGQLQLIFTNYLHCADCYIIVESGSLTLNISQMYMKRVCITKYPIILKYFTGKINPGSGGFKAEIRYFTDFNIIRPNTNCGKYQLIATSGDFQFRIIYSDYYDCIWVLVSDSVPGFFSLSVKSSLPNSSHVDIHLGKTSEGQQLATLKNTESYYGIKLYAVYIRLQGFVGHQSKLDIIYTVKGRQCSFDTFRCDNGACISRYKRCNNQVDCNDHSDENDCSLLEDSRKLHSSSWSYSLIAILVVTAFIILSLCLFFIFICKIRRIRRTSSAISSISANHNHIRMNLTFEGELDAPPTYDEVMAPSNLQGNFNLAFNWSHTNCSEASAMPPTYQEYMRQISSTDDVDSRENNDETNSGNTVQQTLTGSAVEREDSLNRESTNGNKHQTVPTALTTEMNPLGNSLEISQPVLDANFNSNGEVGNYSNDNIGRVHGAESREVAVDQIITNTESYRLPESREAANIRERQTKESIDVKSGNNQRPSIVFLSEQLCSLDNEVYI